MAAEAQDLYAESRRRQDRLEIISELSRGLLSADPSQDVLAAFVRRVRAVTRADLALVAVPDEQGDGLEIVACDGKGADRPLSTVIGIETNGFSPALRFTGPVDTLVDEATAEHLVAVLREALSNAARHARATSVDVELAADAATVTVTVADNGAGLPVGGQRSGLENMRERAEQLGGMFTTAPGLAGGTRVTWSAPAHT